MDNINVEVIDDSINVTVEGGIGPQGPAGTPGAPGVGVPTGGTTDQVLKKASNTDYDTVWGTVNLLPAGNDTEVQFNDNGSFGADSHFYYNKTTDVLHVHGISGDATDGLLIEAQGGTDIGILGAGNSANVTWYGNHNFNNETANTIAGFGASKTLQSLSTGTYPSLTELSYVKGVTSGIQTQLNNKIENLSSFDTDDLAQGSTNLYSQWETVDSDTIKYESPSGVDSKIIIKGHSGQTANLTEWQDSSGTVLASVDSSGRISATGGTDTQPGFRFQGDTDTGFYQWNNQVMSTTGGNWSFLFGDNKRNYINTTTTGTSALTIVPGLTSDYGLVVRGRSGQTANLQEWQNSSGTVLASVSSAGTITAPTIIASSMLILGISGMLYDYYQTSYVLSRVSNPRNHLRSNGDAVVLSIRGTAAQTSNLQEWQNSSGTVLTAIDASGKLLFSTDTNLYRSAADTLKTDDKLVVSDKFNQISAANNAFGSATGLTGVQLSVLTTSASRVGLTIQGHTSQTANLQDWQDSSANILASLTADGKLTFGTTGDTNLYRSAADILKTDDSLVVGTDLEIDGALDHDGTTVGLYGVTPVTRATTGIAEATFTENAGGTAVNVDSTFGGYTLQQVVQALQDIGILT